MDESLSYFGPFLAVGNCLVMTGPLEILVLRQTNTNKGGTDTRKRMDDSADYKRRP